MKFGLQSILFGTAFPTKRDLDDAMQVVAASGFRGVEIAQPVERLAVNDIEELHQVLNKHNLELLGLSGGELATRVAFCGSVRQFWPHYLYIDELDESAFPHQRLAEIPPLAIHPHHLRPSADQKYFRKLLEQFSEILYLPDTAHLALMGLCPVKEVELYFDRLAAVHLKDWTMIHGRSPHQYAKGFCPLGKGGDARIKEVLNRLSDRRWSGWLVAEVDSVDGDCCAAVEECAAFLEAFGHTRSCSSRPKHTYSVSRSISSRDDFLSSTECSDFIQELSGPVPSELAEVYLNAAKSVRQLFSQTACELLIVGNGDSLLKSARHRVERDLVLASAEAQRLARTAVNEQCIRSRSHGDSRVTAIPVPNRFNSHHIRYCLLMHCPLGRLDPVDSSLEDLYWAAQKVSWYCECSLAGMLARAEARSSVVVAKSTDIESLGVAISSLVCSLLRCGQVIWCIPSDGPDSRDVGGKFASTLGALGTIIEPELKTYLGETIRDNTQLEFRFADSEDVEVFRILCSRLNENAATFTEDDYTILEAMNFVVVRNVKYLRSVIRRSHSHQRLLHSLKDPVRWIESSMEVLEIDFRAKSLFPYDLPGDVYSWGALIKQQIQNAEDSNSLISTPPCYDFTSPVRHVVAPAVRHIKRLAEQYNLPLQQRGQDSIRYSKGLLGVGWFFVDRTMMQQVVLNLLENAIKHFAGDKIQFRIEIDADVSDNGVRLIFRDWGPGIPENATEKIFLEGFRGQSAVLRRVKGDGFGLWMVRKIVRLHGGQVWLSKSHSPTEFTVLLPKELIYGPPAK